MNEHDANLTPPIWKFSRVMLPGERIRLDVQAVRAIWVRATTVFAQLQFGDTGDPINLPGSIAPGGTVNSLTIKLPGPVDRIYVINSGGSNTLFEFYYTSGADFAVLNGPVP